MLRCGWGLLWMLLGLNIAHAQLDTIHWLPPMHGREDVGPQYLYLSTPETELFEVTIRNGAGRILAQPRINNQQPFRYNPGNDSDTPVLVPEDSLALPLRHKGLVIDGPKRFYAYFRTHAASQRHAGDLTCKGRAALGTDFRVGQLIQGGVANGRSNFVGFMATADSTVVQLSGFEPNTTLRRQRTEWSASNGRFSITLQRGESAVFSEYLNTGNPFMGLQGAHLQANKPIAVNCGSWLGAPVVSQANDIGIDQIAPFERMGKEYILCKGNGGPNLERAIIIAHVPNTKVWLNGASNPVATLGAGQYYTVSTNEYSANANLYIRSSEPVFVYQTTGGVPFGDDEPRTAGLIFVPPISCGIPNAVDNVSQPNTIGNMQFEGGLMIVAMRDSQVSVRLDGRLIALPFPDNVSGNPDFVTYRMLSLFSMGETPATLSVVAQGAIQVAVYGRNEPASFAAFYSGFSKVNVPEVKITRVGDGICPDTLVAKGRFNGLLWYYEDSLLTVPNGQLRLPVFAPGHYRAVGYLGVCRRTDFAQDTVSLQFDVPATPHTATNPSCFGYADGRISFGLPNGGLPPYSFSVDGGMHYSTSALFTGLSAGRYQLRVRDARGCFDKPLTTALTQPDSFLLHIRPIYLPEPLKPAMRFELEALANRPIFNMKWSPVPFDCADFCRQPIYMLDKSAAIIATAIDGKGCLAMDTLWITVEPNVFAPNVLHAETVAGNDHFTLFTPEPLRIHEMVIYDRWGEQMFMQRNFFTNEPALGWDGQYRGKRVLPGIYVYKAAIEMTPGNVRLFTGEVLVVY